MTDQSVTAAVRSRYLDFADEEANGVSPLYEHLARAVANSGPLLEFVSSLPAAKRQPNLVFAAVRRLHGTPEDGAHLERIVAVDGPAIRSLILARRTQTNEPGRCAVLLPVLARLRTPLALLEVGASAGLCLLPDRWGYDYGRVRIAPPHASGEDAPVFPCRASDSTPLPEAAPQIVWRAGLDLNPIDLSDPDATQWLESLVWPGNDARLERLRAAIRVARQDPPRVVAGDLLTDLRTLAADTPPHATRVVFHSAVLAYLSPEDRARFAAEVRALDAVWISNESPSVFPEFAVTRPDTLDGERFVLAVDGEPVALTSPHGQSIDWLG